MPTPGKPKCKISGPRSALRRGKCERQAQRASVRRRPVWVSRRSRRRTVSYPSRASATNNRRWKGTAVRASSYSDRATFFAAATPAEASLRELETHVRKEMQAETRCCPSHGESSVSRTCRPVERASGGPPDGAKRSGRRSQRNKNPAGHRTFQVLLVRTEKERDEGQPIRFRERTPHAKPGEKIDGSVLVPHAGKMQNIRSGWVDGTMGNHGRLEHFVCTCHTAAMETGQKRSVPQIRISC